ncbi:MAG: amidohydrolase family protein [Mycobacterium sp.]|nr:amidohydrolase family protein [Mycobacterium sp.]
MESVTADLSDHIACLDLVDNHVHGYWTCPVDRRRFENGLNEANTGPLADFDCGFDSQVGFAVRAHCSALLGLAQHAPPEEYWKARSRLGPEELARLFLTAAGVSDWLVDTGLVGDTAGRCEMEQVVAGGVGEIVRLEQVAEEAAADDGDYARRFTDILQSRAECAVATKTVLAYRGGFDGDLTEPDPADVRVRAARWRDAGGTRLTDRVLLRFGIHQALRLGKPVQFHTGLGDRDGDLHRSNPILLLDFLRSSGDCPIVLLHCYPFEREAGYLAQAFSNVYLDTGLSINYLGTRAAAFIARTLELAPFRKLLFSTDAFGPPELHYLGAFLWRDGMASVLAGFVERGQWALDDARRVSTLIGRENAMRLYRL